jgi:hypothetical protein
MVDPFDRFRVYILADAHLARHVAHLFAFLEVEIGAFGTQLVVEYVQAAVRFVTDLGDGKSMDSMCG